MSAGNRSGVGAYPWCSARRPQPGVLPRNAEGAEVPSDTRRRAIAPGELDRLSLADRQRERQADPRVLLPVALFDAVYRAAAARVPGRIKRHPQSRAERVAGMELQCADWVLLP